jgi:hypothetical protein
MSDEAKAMPEKRGRGRPRKPESEKVKAPRQIAHKADLRMLSIRMEPADLEALARIQDAIYARGMAPAHRTQALRWAIRELDARLARGRGRTLEDPPAA